MNKRRLFIALVIGLILLKVLTVTWRGLALMQQASVIMQFASLEQAPARIDELSNAFGNLNSEVGFMYPVLRLFSGDAGAVPDLAAVAQSGLAALKPLSALTPALQTYIQQPDRKNWTAFLNSARQVDWATVANRLHELHGYRDRLVTKSGLSERVEKIVRALDNGLDFGEAAVEAIPKLLSVFADGDDHRLIVLAQNSDELRATGGFITAVAIITIRSDGRIETSFVNSYAVDNTARLRQHPVPPAPMLLYMDLPRWVFRDANWFPDFPTTAQTAARFYALDQDQTVDLVAAINLNTIRALVDAVGPLTLPNSPTPLNGDGALQQMRQAWNIKPETYADSNAKDFLKPFVDALISAIAHSSTDAKLSLLSTVRGLLARSDVLLYATDPGIQAVLSKYGWAGEFLKAAGDSVMLVNTNIGYNKVGPFIQQSLSYHVSLANPDTPFAQVTMIYRNTNPKVPCTENVGSGSGTYEQRMIACYWDWLRLYVPAGTRLLSHTLQPIPAEQMYTKQAAGGIVSAYPQTIGGTDYTLLEGLALIPAGDEQTIQWVYSLPPTLLEHKQDGTLVYRITVQRQAGATVYPLTVSIDLPNAAEMIDTSINGQTALYTIEHQTFTLTLERFEHPLSVTITFREH